MDQVPVIYRGGTHDGEVGLLYADSLDSTIRLDPYRDKPVELYRLSNDVETLPDGRVARVARPVE